MNAGPDSRETRELWMWSECEPGPNPELSREFSAELDKVRAAVDWAKSLAPEWVDPVKLDLGLTEAVTNAIVHGALEVTSEDRATDYARYLSKLQRASEVPPDSSRSVRLKMDLGDRCLKLLLGWRGRGCPFHLRIPEVTLSPLPVSGFGQGIIQACFDEVSWSTDGRAILLVLHRHRTRPDLR